MGKAMPAHPPVPKAGVYIGVASAPGSSKKLTGPYLGKQGAAVGVYDKDNKWSSLGKQSDASKPSRPSFTCPK